MKTVQTRLEQARHLYKVSDIFQQNETSFLAKKMNNLSFISKKTTRVYTSDFLYLYLQMTVFNAL